MKFSDAIYGKTGRYVSRERLGLMLDHEYDLLIERLNAVRGDRTAFFVFADTVAAKSFKGINEAHGWMGSDSNLNQIRRRVSFSCTSGCGIKRTSCSNKRLALSGSTWSLGRFTIWTIRTGRLFKNAVKSTSIRCG